MSVILEILDRPIAFHRCLVPITGSVNSALFLGQAIYWTKRIKGEWFYKTAAEWEEELGLTRREQETARRNLRERGLIEESLRGVPATLHYRVVPAQISEVVKSSFTKSAKLDSPEPPHKNGASSEPITKTTHSLRESTHKNSSAMTDDEFWEQVALTYDYLDIPTERKKMDGWLMSRPGRKLSRRFVINWLNKQDKPLSKLSQLATVQHKPADQMTQSERAMHALGTSFRK